MEKAMSDSQPASVRSDQSGWMDADAYIFDIDGTLLNTRDLVHWNALHQAMLEVYGVDTTIEGIAYHGKTDIGILGAALERAGVTERAFRRDLPKALAVLCREVDRHAEQLVADQCTCIVDVLQKLHSAGKLLGVASGNLQSVGWHKVKAAGLREAFCFGCFSDNCESRVEIFTNAIMEVHSHLGSGASVCFVGDTPADIQAAHWLEAKVIAVSTGTFTIDQLATYALDFLVSSCQELL